MNKRRTIDVVVVVVGLVFLFGFLAVVIVGLFLGIGWSTRAVFVGAGKPAK